MKVIHSWGHRGERTERLFDTIIRYLPTLLIQWLPFLDQYITTENEVLIPYGTLGVMLHMTVHPLKPFALNSSMRCDDLGSQSVSLATAKKQLLSR